MTCVSKTKVTLTLVAVCTSLIAGCCNQSQPQKVVLNTPGPRTIQGEIITVSNSQILEYNIIDQSKETSNEEFIQKF